MAGPVRRHFQHKCLRERGYVSENFLSEPEQLALLTDFPRPTTLGRNNNDGDHVTLSIEDFREALDIVGDAAGQEAAIVAQFALDLHQHRPADHLAFRCGRALARD